MTKNKAMGVRRRRGGGRGNAEGGGWWVVLVFVVERQWREREGFLYIETKANGELLRESRLLVLMI